MKPISDEADIVAALDALRRIDPRLEAVRRAAGPVPLRRVPPGFASLAFIVVSQQVSRSSADAIFSRFERLIGPPTAEAVAAADDEVFRLAGFSRPKQRALVAAAAAVTGGLDLEELCRIDADAAVASLVEIPGIGRWTAECYLLFAAGHPDIFPARDVALQSAAGEALGISPRPGEKQLVAIAESWAPLRSTAARLLWAYYGVLRGREAAPAAAVP